MYLAVLLVPAVHDMNTHSGPLHGVSAPGLVVFTWKTPLSLPPA